ncbi:hypothetical protein GF386_04595 [Candidatus Pacearchaeota archaeon]|nr:hypothetical protein [Candidatus Pacearchaeota archaeon]
MKPRFGIYDVLKILMNQINPYKFIFYREYMIDYERYARTIDDWFEILDDAVIKALKLYSDRGLPSLDLGNYRKPLGVGSGNAAQTVKIILRGKDFVPATESTYEQKLDLIDGVDGVILVSASGEKSAPGIARGVRSRGLEIRLLTCNPDAPAMDIVGSENTFVFPKRPEPYAYNTSTYLGMILGKTGEDPERILDYIKRVDPLLEEIDFRIDEHPAYVFLIPGKFSILEEILRTKFIELFSDRFPRDFFSPEYAEKHAIDIVERDKDTLWVGLGYENTSIGDRRLNIPLPEDADYGTAMAVGYYLVGKIQRANDPWFREGLVDWCSDKGYAPLVE